MPQCLSCEETFDSERGMKIHHSRVHNESLALESSICKYCGEKFEYYPSEKWGVYCESCSADRKYGNGHKGKKLVDRIEVECNNCKDIFELLPCIYNYRSNNNSNMYCSKECSDEHKSTLYIGEGNHRYEGYDFTYSGKWWSIRKKALERDDHTCQSCGKNNRQLEKEPDVHHIIPVKRFSNDQDAHYLENTICLCRSCHRNVEENNIECPSKGR